MAESSELSDLIERAVAGEQPALERLLIRYYDRLTDRLARKLPASLRASVSEEDILQQTFIEVFQRIQSFEPHGERAFYRWLATIADHRLADAVKAQNAAKRGGVPVGGRVAGAFEDDSIANLIDVLSGPERSPSQCVARDEATAAVQVALASIAEDYRSAVRLRYINGLSPVEIAKIMNKTPHAVHNLCYRGLKQLHAVMGRTSQFLTR